MATSVAAVFPLGPYRRPPGDVREHPREIIAVVREERALENGQMVVSIKVSVLEQIARLVEVGGRLLQVPTMSRHPDLPHEVVLYQLANCQQAGAVGLQGAAVHLWRTSQSECNQIPVNHMIFRT